MADDKGSAAVQRPTLRSTLMGLNPKITLAFFLVIVAALMVVFLIRTLTSTDAKLDAGTIALFASFVTMFIKMASDGTGYQFSSSAGSDKKDETQATVSSKLADKVAPAPGAPNPSVPVPPWWSRLSDPEKNAISTASVGPPVDARVAAFITASQVGAATPDDLTYLVSKGLLTQDRADAIKA